MVIRFKIMPHPPYILIGDLKLCLAFAPEASTERLREYLPEGEVFERWNRLASVRVFEHVRDPREYLETVAAAVRQSHPSAKARLLQSEATGALLLDFMTFGPELGALGFAEWNLMRAEFVPDCGLTVYQYAMRVYELGEQCGRIILAERQRMLTPFLSATFEELA